MAFMTRRALICAVAVAGVVPRIALASGTNLIHVVEGTGCACCEQWTRYLQDSGFEVTREERFGVLLMQHKLDLGVPVEVSSCHTGLIDGYFLEGHVPAADIRKLLAERPDARGLAVPGMRPEREREAYDVLLIRKDGSADVFTHYFAN